MPLFLYAKTNFLLMIFPKSMAFIIKFLCFWKPKIFCNLPKIQIKRPNLRIFRQKDANGITNSEDPDKTLL